ncbi:MAG: preprotein translocase subunit SecG [Paracoccaceae bacterium]|nr:preprotein translocase subunit SecG [Paracoccaceae bacterium]
MANIILVIHLILAICLIGVVLLQRSEGGGLGIGGGGGVVTGRSAANALVTLTWIFAVGFIATSIALTVLAARDAAGDSVIKRLGTPEPAAPTAPAPVAPKGNLLPPSTTDAPALPPKPTQ